MGGMGKVLEVGWGLNTCLLTVRRREGRQCKQNTQAFQPTLQKPPGLELPLAVTLGKTETESAVFCPELKLRVKADGPAALPPGTPAPYVGSIPHPHPHPRCVGSAGFAQDPPAGVAAQGAELLPSIPAEGPTEAWALTSLQQETHCPQPRLTAGTQGSEPTGSTPALTFSTHQLLLSFPCVHSAQPAGWAPPKTTPLPPNT